MFNKKLDELLVKVDELLTMSVKHGTINQEFSYPAEEDLFREADTKEVIRSFAEIPYILKFFDTLIYHKIVQKSYIPSSQTALLDMKQGEINQIRSFKELVKAEMRKEKE